MKKIIIVLCLGIFNFFPAIAQVNYSEHIAPIIYEKCTSCHRPGEIAPFSLTNYEEVAAWSGMVQYVTEIKAGALYKGCLIWSVTGRFCQRVCVAIRC